MSDYKVELVEDNISEFHVVFKGPPESAWRCLERGLGPGHDRWRGWTLQVQEQVQGSHACRRQPAHRLPCYPLPRRRPL